MNDTINDLDQEAIDPMDGLREAPDQEYAPFEESPFADDGPDPLFAPPEGRSEFDQLRRPPYSREAEQSVLGAILLDNSTMDEIADILEPEDFYIGAHQAIYQAMITLLDRGDPADPVTLRQYLEKGETLHAVGGAAYLAELVNTVPTTANAKAYARLVHDKAVLKELSHQATSIVESIYSGNARVDTILDEAEQRIFGVGERMEQRRSNYYDLRSIIGPVFDSIEQRMESGREITGVTTGFLDLDALTSGMQPADLVILAGRPSMGKTALAMNIAANAALEGRQPVAVFSLEMSKEQLASRLLASTARIDAQNLRTGRIREDEYYRMTQAASLLSETPIYVDDTPAISIAAFRAKARRLKREKGVQMLVVDYLQLMRGSTRTQENRVQEISEISQGLKAVAKELNIPVLALSQLSRAVESRTDKRPILSDLRESGSIEQDADIVMFVFREEYYKPEDTNLRGLAEVIIAKQRNGPTGNVKLTFLNQYTRFENFVKGEF